ncbi:hypothetical protein C8R45DRAFT_1094871 [Mycena sanguinolenta]|nr:hypothetical protein C8R45DRAFT_1094871 [Mycena sanguinolenta]
MGTKGDGEAVTDERDHSLDIELILLIQAVEDIRLPPDLSDDGLSGSSSSTEKSDHKFPYITPGALYGTIVPTIELKLKPELLLEWDGDHDSAVDYFWEVNQLASLLGWLPRTLGFWLPT